MHIYKVEDCSIPSKRVELNYGKYELLVIINCLKSVSMVCPPTPLSQVMNMLIHQPWLNLEWMSAKQYSGLAESTYVDLHTLIGQ